MKRQLALSGPRAPRRFETFYQGLLMGGQKFSQRSAGFGDVRIEAALLTKLKEISKEQDETYPTGDAARILDGEDRTLLLTQPEVDLLKRYMEATPWRVAIVEDVVDSVDFLLAAKEVDDLENKA